MSLLQKIALIAGMVAAIVAVLSFFIKYWKPLIGIIRKNKKMILKIILSAVIIISIAANIYFIFVIPIPITIPPTPDDCEKYIIKIVSLEKRLDVLEKENQKIHKNLNLKENSLLDLKQEYDEFRTGVSQELSQELSGLIAEGNTYGDFEKWSEKSELLLGIIDNFLHCCYNNNTYNYREQFLDSIRFRQGDEITSAGHITQTDRGVRIFNNTQEYLNRINGDNDDNQ